MQDVGAHPDDMSARQTFAAAATSLTQGFRRISSELTNIANQSDTRLNNTVTEINTITQRIAQLNSQIRDSVGSASSRTTCSTRATS